MKSIASCGFRGRGVVALVALLLAGVFSCEPKSEAVDVEARVELDKVYKHGMSIVGCVSIPDTSFDFTCSQKFSSALKGALVTRHPGMKVIDWGSVRKAAGDSLIQHCMRSLYDYGSLDSAELDSLAVKLAGMPRFLVVHRIEDEFFDFDADDKYSDVNGKQEKTSKVYQTYRHVTARFIVYDARSHQQVWAGTVNGVAGAEKEVPVGQETEEIGGTLGEIFKTVEAIDKFLGGTSEGGEPSPYPPVPSRGAGMRATYDKFAEEFLKGK